MSDIRDVRARVAQFDGGEFTDLTSGYPYTVVFPGLDSQAVVYATKKDVALQLLTTETHEFPVGLVGRYGFPRDEDLSGIANLVRGHTVYFLGDCDPFDLLVYSLLQQHLSIRYLGISDAVVDALGVEIDERMTIPLPVEEQQAMLLVREVWTEFGQAVGPRCAQLLESNRKVELEALVSFRTRPGSNLLHLL